MIEKEDAPKNAPTTQLFLLLLLLLYTLQISKALFEEVTVFTEDEITSSTGSLNLISERPSDGEYCIATQLHNPIREYDTLLDLR